MLYDNCRQAVLFFAAALLASSCAENVKPNLPSLAAKSEAGTATEAKTVAKTEEKKSKKPADDDDDEADGKPNPALLDPSLAKDEAPDKFKAKFLTTKGEFVIEVTRDWAPNGADRFYNLVKIGYFKDVAFFRNIEGFMVQFGLNGDPKVNAKWSAANIKDDRVKESNKPGYITFAQASSPNSRSTQFFINFGDNSRLDRDRFAPFGKVIEGMDIVNSLYNGYGESAPQGRGPEQGRLKEEGNAYLKKSFPKLDYIKRVSIID